MQCTAMPKLIQEHRRGRVADGVPKGPSAMHSAWSEPWRGKCFIGGKGDGQKEKQR